MTVNLQSLPAGALVLLGVVALAQVVLCVLAIVSLVRRPKEAVALENKWLWLAIIVLVNMVGPILYFAIGRKPMPLSMVEAAPGSAPNPAPNPAPPRNIADELYGPGSSGGLQ